MTTHLPSQDEPSVKATSAVEGLQAAVPPHASAPQPVVLSTQQEPEEEESFYFEEEQPDLVGTPFVAPFQLSSALPTLAAQEQESGQAFAGPAPVKKAGRTPRFSLTMIALLLCVVVLVGLLVMNALAQTTPPLQTHGSGTSPTTHQPGPPQQKPPGNQQTLTMQPTPAPTNGTHGQGQGPASTDWVPQQFPDGWTQAGLLTEDAIQAIRTAVAFTDREMSLDYRSVGTRDNHGGTFTAATFVLTPAARQRFAHNDVREINNTLFDMVANTRLVRVVLDPQPQLVKFAELCQQQFAWVAVAFQLWQSQIDPNHPQLRMEGKDIDPATNQPRIQHMIVLLLRVLSQNAGNNPAMGGTGWLVSAYTLNPAHGTLPAIVQPA